MGPSGPDGPTQPISLANIGMSGLPGIQGTGTYKVVSAFVAVGSGIIYEFQNVVSNNSAVQGIYRIVVSRAPRTSFGFDDRRFTIGELFIAPLVIAAGVQRVSYFLGPLNNSRESITASHQSVGTDFKINITLNSTYESYSVWIIQIQSPLLTQVLSIA
jgi:hypothetical protein